ncbi:hypothetical protein KVT40_005458 [Elsinoe batatas]|uniref:Uncharacterized protein n=1 Tax=Elsinoe batatas TaxID=2601811 RepID=A0A8K0L693_9PEZI|nr:hypothetical protein KVT40_005458 [Elsinoe batatas]
MQNVYRWKAESVLPSREANNAGFGGYHRSFYEKEANRKREMEQDWKWYDDSGGNEAFRQYQQFTELDEAVGSAYLVEDKTPLSLVLGPYGNQHMFKLPPLGAMAIDEPFIAESENTNTPKRKPTKRSGWIVNIGERIQTLGWAPNQDGDIQYLALAAMTMETAVEPELPSAFVPQATPKKSAIQIWSFRRSADGYFDQTTPPKLCQVICSEFGDVRLLKWCRAPRPHKVLHEDAKDLGLLAGIWGDGHIRVLDITVPTPDLPTQYLHLDSVAFHTRPPDAVFSSLSWVSAHSMIGATSNGGMALFSLPSSLGTNPATPIVSSPLQSTYITTITTCYPSRPHIVLSTCLAGYLSMTDLTRVTTSSGINPSNTVLSPRSRIGRQTMTWHDWSQMLVTIDDNQTLQGLPLRRFYGYSGLGRVRAGVVTIAPSECHPFIAAGQVNGEVSTTNIMRKVSNSKETLVVGRWFQHTWRRTETPKLKLPGSNEQEGTSEGQAVEEAPTKADKGIARFVEGFKPELSMILKPTDSRNPTLFTTIHEAQTAITEVAWNPNLGCGGWIAAGTASGLLRVEDLGIP